MGDPTFHVLKATPETVQWGYFDRLIPPVLRIRSGDIVAVESLTHHAGDAPDLMMDDAVQHVYETIPVTDRGPGVHLVTGPIYVEGAEIGDVLECRVLDLTPRLPYGSNFEANWGLLYEEFDRTEHVVIWQADTRLGVARAAFQYPFPGKLEIPGTITPPGSIARAHALSNISVPLRLHLGTAGVAPAVDGRVSTIPPANFGGNVDNRWFGTGTSMFYPVLNEGALFWCGDSHFAEGDGEISGTAIEGHLNATIQLTVHKDTHIHNPVLETPQAWMCHAFDRDLNEAMRLAALEAIEFLVDREDLTRHEAYSLLSVAGDFHVTQVVDDVKGIHVVLRRDFRRL